MLFQDTSTFLTATVRYAMQTFLQYLFTDLLKQYLYQEPVVNTSKQTPATSTLSAMEKMTLRHMVGAIIRKALRKGRKMLNEEDYTKLLQHW